MKWSYSALDMYQQCPRKYHEIRVLKKYPKQQTDALMYGNDCHEAAEKYLNNSDPLPDKFKYIQSYLDVLAKIPGTRYCEYKMGLTKDLQPCGIFDKEGWWMGIADLVVIQGDIAYVVDYKTGKSSRYADYDQLEIMALALFKHFPQIKIIKAALLFIVAKDFKDETYKTDEAPQTWLKWFKKIQRLEDSYEQNTWNAIPNFTCRNYCPCTGCEHHGG